MLMQRTLPPDPSSAMVARAFARDVLATWEERDALEVVTLLVSELVANAVLHAGTKVEVVMKQRGQWLRVEVADESPVLPGLREFDPDATTGRGLTLVELLAADWGVEPCDEGGKLVWFEVPALHTTEETPEEPAGDRVIVLSDDEVVIRLLGAPVQLFPATQQHTEALLREYALMAMQLESGQTAPRLVLDMRAVAAQINAAVESGRASADLVIAAPESAKASVADACVALEVADRLAEDGQLLSAPAVPEVRWCRDWFLGEVVRQLSGDAPTPWTMAAIRTDARRQVSVDHRAALDQLRQAVVVADDQNHIAYVNRATEELLGWGPGSLEGQRLTALIPERLHEAHLAGYTRFQVTRQPRLLGRPVRVPARRRDGSEVEVELVIDQMPGEGGRQMFIALLRPFEDSSAAVAEQGRRRLQMIDSVVNAVQSLDADRDAQALLGAVAGELGWPVATWWTVDGETVSFVDAWSGSSDRFRGFIRVSEGRQFDRGEGLPGRTWVEERAFWVPDVVADANFPRMAAALQHGLRTACAFPVRRGNDICGIVELFSDDVMVPDDDLLSALDTVGRVLGFTCP